MNYLKDVIEKSREPCSQAAGNCRPQREERKKEINECKINKHMQRSIFIIYRSAQENFFFSRVAAEHPLREKKKKKKKKKSRKKLKITYFAERFLCEISRTNSAKVRGDTPRDFAEKLREISQWVGKDQMFLHADSEDSYQTQKLSKCPAWSESPLLDGS